MRRNPARPDAMLEAELEALAADRPLHTPELHRGNDFYGNAAVLKAFANCGRLRSLKVAIEHGIPLETKIWGPDLETSMPVFLSASPARARAFEEEAGDERIAVAIGPLLEYARPERLPRSGRRLLAFPAHSTHHVDATYDSEGFAERLAAEARDFDSLTVCIYWKEILRGMHRPYLARGFECVTAGHMFDPGFLPRLRSYIDEADAVITNQVGSQLLYPASRGLPVALARQPLTYRVGGAAILEADRTADPIFRPFVHAQKLFGDTIAEPSAAAADFVEEVTGREQLRSPAALRAILVDAEDRYRKLNAPTKRLRDRLRWLKHEAQVEIERFRPRHPPR